MGPGTLSTFCASEIHLNTQFLSKLWKPTSDPRHRTLGGLASGTLLYRLSYCCVFGWGQLTQVVTGGHVSLCLLPPQRRSLVAGQDGGLLVVALHQDPCVESQGYWRWRAQSAAEGKSANELLQAWLRIKLFTGTEQSMFSSFQHPFQEPVPNYI